MSVKTASRSVMNVQHASAKQDLIMSIILGEEPKVAAE